MLLEEALAFSVSHVGLLVGINNPNTLCALSYQLINAFPVPSVCSGKHSVLINCHELLLSGDSFERLLLLDQKQVPRKRRVSLASNEPTTSTASNEPTTTASIATAGTSTTGRPPLVSKFPTVCY